VALTDRIPRLLQFGAAMALAATVVLAALRIGLSVDVVKKAAGIPDSAEGVGKFIVCRAAGYAESALGGPRLGWSTGAAVLIGSA
jgi:hypothetical protein